MREALGRMLADMHCHYPMHLAAEDPKRSLPGSPNLTVDAMTKFSKRPGWVGKLRAAILRFLSNFLNFRDDHWRVSLNELERGEVRCVFSVLYEPFAEFDLVEPPGAEPEQGYFCELLEGLKGVEDDLEEIDQRNERHEFVSTVTDLNRVAKEERKVAFMHCVEGGFHLGETVDEVKENVAKLKEKGVVYVTLAHLFWRGVATNAPAIPFLKDRCYKTIFHQPQIGLSDLGRAAVEAMYKQRILIDVSHMSERALEETFDLLEELDKKTGAAPAEHPVIATHAGYRFGKQEYMLSPRTIRRIAARGGVIGLILARHQLHENAEVANPDDPKETHAVLRRHIDAIRMQVPGHTNAHVAIGSDLDGFIKPTVAGIETSGDLATLAGPLKEAYGDDAEMILSGNAMRVVGKALNP